MRQDANANTVVFAVAKAIVAKFGDDDWVQLGFETETSDLIDGHSRLLRSMQFGDDDYFRCVIDVLPRVLGDHGQGSGPIYVRYSHLSKVEDLVNLELWLMRHERELYDKLYEGGSVAALDQLAEAAATAPLDGAGIEEHERRIRSGLKDDPALAVGSTKDLLETVLKQILGLHGTGPETKKDLPALRKDADRHLGLAPSGSRGSEPGAAQRVRLLSGLAQIVQSAAELRNGGFGTGHGVSRRTELDLATARLAVTAGVAAAHFYLEAHADREQAASTDRNIPF